MSQKKKGRNKATFRLFNEKVMNYLSPKNELISSPQFGQTGDNDEGVLTVDSDILRIQALMDLFCGIVFFLVGRKVVRHKGGSSSRA